MRPTFIGEPMERMTVVNNRWTIVSDRPEAELKVIRENLICWNRSGLLLWAIPSNLAYLEALETFPGMQVSVEILNFVAAIQNPTLSTVTEPGLYPTQISSVQKLLRLKKALLLAMPRAGKTIITLTALKLLSRTQPIREIVIIAPLSLLENWRTEVTKWLLPELKARNRKYEILLWWKAAEARMYFHPASIKILITSNTAVMQLGKENKLYELFEHTHPTGRFLILDESFLYKNRKTKNFDAASELSGYFENCWELSGMPSSKFLDDLYAQVRIVRPDIKSYWKFVQRYCFIEENFWSSTVIGNRPDGIQRLLRDFPETIVQAEAPEGLNELKEEIVACKMENRQAAIYKELKINFRVEAELLGRNKPLTLKNLLSLTTRLRQVASNPMLVDGIDISAKRKALLERLPNCLPAIIWIEFIRTGEDLKQKLEAVGFKVGLLTGATPKQDRGKIVQQFQMGELDIIIAHPGVGKYGHTLSAAKYAFYLEKNFAAEPFYQSLFRGRKIDNPHPLIAVYLLAEQTIDEWIHKVLMTSKERTSELTIQDLLQELG